MRNSGPIFTLLLSLSAVNAFGQHIALSFDSLPTAQGWTYFQGGVPESSVFSVTGVSLIQNTIGTGFGNGNPNYALFGVVDDSKPFVLTVRARVLATEGPGPGAFGFFFDVRTAVPNQEYAIGLTTSLVTDPLGNGVAIDTTTFHEYVLRATPGGPYTLDIDGQFAFGGPFSATGGPLNALQIGDGNNLTSNARAEVTKFDFRVVTPPLYGVCLLYDPTKAVHSGATIPIKLQLCDGNGTNLSSSSISVQAIGISQVSNSISGAVEDAGNSNPDNNFRFDATLGRTGGYIFNLKTTGLTQGTYRVNFIVTGDSSVYAAEFQVK